MVKQVIHSVTDDLDGSPDAAEVTFTLGNQSYAIDLAPKNEARLRDALQPFIDAGRKMTRLKAAAGATRSGADRERNQAVRQWARDNGVELPSRGRIAQGYLDAYDDSNIELLYRTAGLELPEKEKPKRRKKATEAKFSESP
jgi:hypothetical protein